MGIETAIALGVTGAVLAATSAGVGAYSNIQQGNFAKAASDAQASQIELEGEQLKSQRAAEKVNESDQMLERSRQLDSLFREQRVAAASSGLMGESFSAIQANDLSSYSREQNMTSIYTSARDSNASMQLTQLKNQIASTRAAGAAAQKMGIIGGAMGGLQSASSIMFGANNAIRDYNMYTKK